MENISTNSIDAVKTDAIERQEIVVKTESELDDVVRNYFNRDIAANDPYWISDEARNLVPNLLAA